LLLLSCSPQQEPKKNEQASLSIYFLENSSALSRVDSTFLNSIGSYLKANPKQEFTITGYSHPSEIGHKNQELASKRFQTVSNYLNTHFSTPKPQFINTGIVGPTIGDKNWTPPADIEYRKVIIERKK